MSGVLDDSTRGCTANRKAGRQRGLGRAARTAGANKRSRGLVGVHGRQIESSSHCRLNSTVTKIWLGAAMSGRRIKNAAAALLGALVTSAGAADLLPPTPSRHAPHTLPLRQSPPGSI